MLQKYRADYAGDVAPNGAVEWMARWMGGPTLALVRKCPVHLTVMGQKVSPRTVYITGDADSFFTIPAACQVRINGRRVDVLGYVSYDDDGPSFTPDTRFR